VVIVGPLEEIVLDNLEVLAGVAQIEFVLCLV
jgi:hypothetical protein